MKKILIGILIGVGTVYSIQAFSLMDMINNANVESRLTTLEKRVTDLERKAR